MEGSLADFKGKVVYIDFWGVYCGPCIYDIQHYVPQIHEHYKDKDVVFINICVDVGETQWKAALKKHNLHGINLIAEGWSRHPVCRSEEHTSELQSLMRISYAVLRLKKKTP